MSPKTANQMHGIVYKCVCPKETPVSGRHSRSTSSTQRMVKYISRMFLLMETVDN